MNWVFNYFFSIITRAKKIKKKRLGEGLSIPTTDKDKITSEEKFDCGPICRMVNIKVSTFVKISSFPKR
jgi:hypothetical protein